MCHRGKDGEGWVGNLELEKCILRCPNLPTSKSLPKFRIMKLIVDEFAVSCTRAPSVQVVLVSLATLYATRI